MSETKVLNPPARWAQRKDRIFLTIEVEDSEKPDIKLVPDKLMFSSKGGHEQQVFKLELEFFKEVIPEESTQHITARDITFNIKKKDQTEPYWPRLQKGAKKPHYLKTDFNRWRDEDDSEGEDGEFDDSGFEHMMSQMGGSDAGKPMEPKPDSDDSDDEGLPDLES